MFFRPRKVSVVKIVEFEKRSHPGAMPLGFPVVYVVDDTSGDHQPLSASISRGIWAFP